jgi:hypothetical protein
MLGIALNPENDPFHGKRRLNWAEVKLGAPSSTNLHIKPSLSKFSYTFVVDSGLSNFPLGSFDT